MASHKRKRTRSDKHRGINGPACLLHKKHWIWFNVGFWCWDISVRLPFYWQIRAHKDTERKVWGKRLISRQESQGGILTGNLSSGSQGTLCEKNSFECLCDLVESPLRPIFRRNWEKFLCESGRLDYRYIWALWAFHVMNWYSEVGGKLELDTERKGIVNAQGRIPLPNRMIFWKNSKRPLTPLPPHLWKIMLQIFYNGYGHIYARRHRPDSIS